MASGTGSITLSTVTVAGIGQSPAESYFTVANLDVTINLSTTPLRPATSANKGINLVNLLPVHLEYSETGEFLEFFQVFLNEMYDEYVQYRGNNSDFTVNNDGIKDYFRTSATSAGDTIYTSAGTYYTSAGSITTNLAPAPVTFSVSASPMIGILEKIRRLADFHDPDLIDIEYINQLANYLGYDISIFSSNNDEVSDTITEYETQRYLRHIVSSLPDWYKIKSTNNAIKILLYSFGIVATIANRWTSDVLSLTSAHPATGGYGNDTSLWVSEDNDSSTIAIAVSSVPSNYFPTPHFKIKVNQALAQTQWFENIDRIFAAIESIRSINTVLDSIDAIFYQLMDGDKAIAVRIDHFATIYLHSTESTSMSLLNVNYPYGGLTFTSATDDLVVKWGIGFHPTCASPVSSVDLAISYDNKVTWTTLSATALNLIVSGAGTNLFNDTSALGIFTSASWPASVGDGSSSYIRAIEVYEGTLFGNNNVSAYSNRFTVI